MESHSPVVSFPDPVVPPPHVDVARENRLREVTRATLYGIAVRSVVIAVEFIAVAFTQSSVLFVDAVASLFDTVSSLILLAAIRFAARPPDDSHPFGHGRAEPLAGFQLAVLLAGTGLWMAWRNLFAVQVHPGHEPLPWWTWMVSASTAIALGFVSWRIRVAGRASRSTALESEAMHFQIDMWTSLVATVSLGAAALVPDWSRYFDHFGGALLAIVMVVLGVLAARENLNQLLDRVPHDDDFARVKKSAVGVAGVIDVEKVRIQHAGPDAHVDVDVEVDPKISVEESHQIAQHVRAQIQSDWPSVREVVVHIEPYYAGDH